ncbi:MAG TPA: TIGR03619 family F420-dependent LLM class oxidoreductase [Solirubrobacteraceae bacterium]|jgi:probable F420-dependent oxidoreductase|nr:TIGR03619 family F420-dependent LLM class oxidoreductase [Solirubrobacteraceae bacterium]
MQVGISERFGAAGHDLAHVSAIALAIEDRGFDSYWTPEHLAVRAGGDASFEEGDDVSELARAPSFPDPFVNLAVVAAATTSLLIGTGVLLVPLHHPLAIARAGATLDALSGGRFVLGAGIGWDPWEYESLGVPWAERGLRAVEHLQAVRALWDEHPASFAGEHIAFERVVGEPRPATRVPILLGGNSEGALRRAVKVGDGWFGWGLDHDALHDARRRLMMLLAAAGRDPAEFTIQLGTRFDGDRSKLARYAAGARARGVDRLVVTCGPEGTVSESELDAIRDACEPLGACDSRTPVACTGPSQRELASGSAPPASRKGAITS